MYGLIKYSGAAVSDLEHVTCMARVSNKTFCLSDWDGMDEVVARLFHARLAPSGSNRYDWKHLPSPLTLKNMPEVLEVLSQARAQQKRIVIVGDYDCDGATSIAIMYTGFKKLGFEHIYYVVPHRFVHGYGLTDVLIPKILEHKPDLVITVDNGIQSVAAVKQLKDLGVEVIITDHHLPGQVLPDALIVNPNQGGCLFEDKHIAGCGVAWYIMVALRSHLKLHSEKINFNDLTIYAAIGTVADCVQLTHVNRVIVQQGLQLMRSSQAPLGLKVLMKLAKVQENRISSVDIAFRLAPRLNAAGRLEDMSLGVQCLLAHDYKIATSVAAELDRLNSVRQEIQQTMELQAFNQIEEGAGAVVFHEQWHQGIVGLIASKVKERLKRPVIAFAWDAVKSCYKGSGRSIVNVHIKHILDEMSLAHPDLMINFGGHAMAAGLSVSKEQWPRFKDIFINTCQNHVAHDHKEPDVIHDGWLEEKYMNADWFEKLYTTHPFGQGFEEPLYFARLTHAQSSVTSGGHVKIEAMTQNALHKVVGWIFSQGSKSSLDMRVASGDIVILFQFLSGGRQFSVKVIAWCSCDVAKNIDYLNE